MEFYYIGQWEFQVGPAVGISAGDELWVARYILEVNIANTSYNECLIYVPHNIWMSSKLKIFSSSLLILKLFVKMQRITEIAGVVLSFDPKPIQVCFHMFFLLYSPKRAYFSVISIVNSV